MLLKIYNENPAEKNIKTIANILKNDGVVIIPTDSVYGIACDIFSKKAIARVAQLKGLKPENADFSFLFCDLSEISEYTRPMGNDIFKVMKKNLPGPFTFILRANNKIPKLFRNKKRELGVRIPDNNIVREIIKEIGNPILTTSVHKKDVINEYTTDPSLIHDKYKNLVDIVIDGGYGNNKASTVIDSTENKINIVRQGVKELK